MDFFGYYSLSGYDKLKKVKDSAVSGGNKKRGGICDGIANCEKKEYAGEEIGPAYPAVFGTLFFVFLFSAPWVDLCIL